VTDAGRDRRPPPPFRRVEVVRRVALSPRLVRVTLAGAELAGLPVPEPAASVRVLLPGPDGLVLPTWSGNEFLLPDGRRPLLRTLTPRRYDPEGAELDVDVVVHGEGAASRWAAAGNGGDPAALSGPARGYRIDPAAGRFLLAGDETAVPAMSQLVESIGSSAQIELHAEMAAEEARIDLPTHPGLTAAWHSRRPGEAPGAALVEAVAGARLDEDTRVWVAGEAAAVQRIRRLLFEERGLPRASAAVRGYWKLATPATP